MLSWYDRSRLLAECPELYAEAGVTENVFFALLTAMLTGFDLGALRLISEKTDTPIEVISKPKSDNIWREVEDVLNQKKDDPRVKAMLEKSKKLATEVISESKEPSTSSTEWDDIVRAVIQVEGAAEDYVGASGDTGVMQVLPSTWEEMNRTYFNGKYPYRKFGKNKKINILMGRTYLQHIKKWLESRKSHLKGDPMFLMFAAYNGGIGNVERMGFDPRKIEQHLPRVFDYATRAMNLVSS